MYLRELVNPPSQTTNLATPLQPGQSLIYRSTGSEVRELSGSKDRPAVFCSNSLQDRIRCGGRQVRFLRQKYYTIYLTLSNTIYPHNMLIFNALRAYV
jgi:hypothetical protein